MVESHKGPLRPTPQLPSAKPVVRAIGNRVAARLRPKPVNGSTVGDTRAVGRLTIVCKGNQPIEVNLSQQSTLIGRSRTCDVVIDSPRVSRQHCRIIAYGSEFWLMDLASSNGLTSSGERIRTCKLTHGQIIYLSGRKDQSVYIQFCKQ